MKKRILYIKNSASKINLNTYNVQAVGLGKAFCKLGYDYDFLFFSNQNAIVQQEIINGKLFRIISKKGVRILRSYYCKSILNREYLKEYDFVISTEYGQLMTYFLSKTSDNIVMYSGPYYNLFKLPFISPLYDFLFTKRINESIKYKFVKSELAKKYLEKKGYTNLINIGVALDIERFDVDIEVSSEVKKLIKYMQCNECMLYVGALSKRKNYPFLLKIYKKIHAQNSNIKFVIIGKGEKKYVSRYLKRLTEDERSGIYHLEQIDNTQLKFIYPLAKVFLLPSKKEIFGMVLLEAMYLGAPVVTSWNGGSSTLIAGKRTGQIVKKFNVSEWEKAILKYLDNDDLKKEVVNNAHELVNEQYNWKMIASRMLDNIFEKNQSQKLV